MTPQSCSSMSSASQCPEAPRCVAMRGRDAPASANLATCIRLSGTSNVAAPSSSYVFAITLLNSLRQGPRHEDCDAR